MAPVSIRSRTSSGDKAVAIRLRRILRYATHLIIGGVVATPLVGVLAWVLQIVIRPEASWYGTVSVLIFAAVALLVPPMLTVTQGMQRIAAIELLGATVPSVPDGTWPTRLRSALWYFYSVFSGLLFVAGLVFCLPTLVSVPFAVALDQQASFDEFLAFVAPGTPTGTSLPWVLGLCLLVLVASLTMATLLRPVAEALLGPSQRQLRIEAERRSLELARRNEVARELHDSVGHALTVTTLQASAARRLLQRNPQAADQAMAAVERAGRAALAELDEVLGILRAPAGPRGPGIDPAPPGAKSLAVLEQLLEDTRLAGLRVTATLPESTTAVPPEVARAAFRVIQEGLTNAMKHGADSQCTLTVDVLGDRRRGAANIVISNAVSVRDSGNRLGGKGLTGVKERAVALGGSVAVGPADGQWLLEAKLPWGQEGTP